MEKGAASSGVFDFVSARHDLLVRKGEHGLRPGVLHRLQCVKATQPHPQRFVRAIQTGAVCESREDFLDVHECRGRIAFGERHGCQSSHRFQRHMGSVQTVKDGPRCLVFHTRIIELSEGETGMTRIDS